MRPTGEPPSDQPSHYPPPHTNLALAPVRLQPLPYLLPRTVGDSGHGAGNGWFGDGTASSSSSGGSAISSGGGSSGSSGSSSGNAKALSGFFVAGQGLAPASAHASAQGPGLAPGPGQALHRGQGLVRRVLRACSGCPLALCGDCETGISEVTRRETPPPI